ncbi:MAG: DUF3473 domain-containing protein, partial [Rubritepida sp.]|nr:DUF3473 domain-containing protein [Rubritepida sp.]
YFHPWEIDPGQPRVAAGMRSRLRHYTGLASKAPRLARLLRDFNWGRLDDVHAAALGQAAPPPGMQMAAE